MSSEQNGSVGGVREGELERRADWAEQFFDLVFVLAVAEIDRSFVDQPTAIRAVITLAVFVPVWWAWVGFAFFATRFPADNASVRLALLAASGASLVMAAGIRETFDGHGAVFALGYGLLRVILASLYWLNRGQAGTRGSLAEGFARMFTLGGLLWIVSALVPPPWRYLLWTGGLLVDLAAPLRFHRTLASVPVDSSHLPERFGLFVMIVIGETLAATGSAVSETRWDLASVMTASAGFVASCAICWAYFNRAGTIFAGPIAERVNSGVYARDLYSYGHFPIVVGIVSMASGTEMLVRDSHVHTGAIALSLGFALVLATLALLQRVLVRHSTRRVPAARLLASACCVLLALCTSLGAGRLVVSVGVATVGLAVSLWIVRLGADSELPHPLDR